MRLSKKTAERLHGDCRIAVWYGLDSVGWPRFRREAYLDNLPRIHAEWRIERGDLSGLNPDQLEKLYVAAYGEEGKDEVWFQAMEAQLLARVQQKD